MDGMVCKVLEFGSQEHTESIELRRKVLRRPLGLDFTKEELSSENKQYHIACFKDNGLIGILLMKPLDGKRLKMRQVAVDGLVQGHGTGTFMVAFTEKWARENGYDFIELSARKTAVNFYLRMGYHIEGGEFMEVGIPHYRMTKALS